MATIKLTRAERNTIARQVRRDLRTQGYEPGYGIDAATGRIETLVEALGRFDDTPYADISDYALSFARFICPREARDS